jgi:LacI family transcriptional regulator
MPGGMGKMEAKYTRVYETLKRDILSGKYSSRNPFPSVAMIIRRFAISNLTAVKVLEKLKNDGLVKSYQGRGTFVTNNATSRKIGLIVPGVACTDFFQPIVSEINQLARKEDYTLLFAEVFSMDRDERIHQVRELAAEFIKKRVAGVIYEPLAEPGGKEANEHILRVFKRARIPVVLIDCDIVPFPQRSEYDVVGVNDVEAGAKIANHLIEVGAKNIHFLVSKLCPTTFLDRLYGAEAELIRAGRFKNGSVLYAEPDDVTALKRHIKRNGKPDAFVCSNDPSAAVFCKTLEKAGLSLPKDVLLTGFADMPIAALMSPPLTTIRQERDQLGGRAFKRLLERIANPTLPANEIFFPAPLVARESTVRKRKDKGGRKK